MAPKLRYITPLYKRDQWTRWQDLFHGTKSAMLWTFDEWLQNHNAMVKKFKAQGDGDVHEVEVDFDAFIIWTKAGNLLIDGNTRNAFAGHILRERMKAAGDFSY